MDGIFERLAKKHDPKFVSSTLISTMKEIEREGRDTANITERHLDALFRMSGSGKIAREAAPDVLRAIAENPGRSIEDIVRKTGAKRMSASELERVVKKTLREKKDLMRHPRREKMLMGLVMKEVRGRAEGKTVLATLLRELKKAG